MLCLGHRIKYENPEVGNTTQQFLSTTRPCCSIEFIESFLFWVIIITYKQVYIFVYIFIKLAILIIFCYLHFMLNILTYKNIFCETDEAIASKHDPSSNMILLGVHSESTFPFMEFFFLKKIMFLLVSLAYCWVNQSRYVWLTYCGVFLKTTSASWIILSISLDGLNSIDWLWKSWLWVFLK